jgi:hypothetical protein
MADPLPDSHPAQHSQRDFIHGGNSAGKKHCEAASTVDNEEPHFGALTARLSFVAWKPAKQIASNALYRGALHGRSESRVGTDVYAAASPSEPDKRITQSALWMIAQQAARL